ncbi:MAG: 1-deoxy-D-xylulose-5-phosphate synthase [Rubrivivax sp.]
MTAPAAASVPAAVSPPAAPLLDRIDTPADLRKLSRAQLKTLATELRQRVVDVVSQTGGHFGSNLGTVELTIALHYVFDTPRDRIVWDVGHQTYPHKILTGRRDRMHTLRQLGGIGGFPRRDESEYDTFGTAHSSTSISAALGMSIAARLKGENRKAVAVIGDGAMTAGMAFEAMNNAGVADAGQPADMLVVLNDNDMSISPPVGALNNYLARLMSGKFYAAAREGAKTVLRGAPPLFEFARRFEEHAKGMVVPGTIFEEFGFNYVGPIDGHDLDALIPTLENLRDKKGPQFLHIVTKKGYGYEPAEADPVKYHAASGKFDPKQGFPKSAPGKPTFTQIFGQWLCDMAEADARLVGITPAMREGSGMVEFHKRFPKRYHDVGIAEQHAVTFAAGLACEGLKPVVAIYSTFLQRGYDQLIHDVAIQNLPVVFALDRGGVVGADGATHCGAFDIPYIRCIPNLSLIAPSDEEQCRRALTTAFRQDHPVAVRYPRGAGAGVPVSATLEALPWGRGEVRRRGARVAILAFGTLLHPALAAAEKLDATVADMKFVKPLDVELVLELARSHEAIVTIEEGATMGGAGSAVGEALAAAGVAVPMLQLGLPDRFLEHGDPAKLLAQCGLDAAGIERSVLERFGSPLVQVRPAVNG